MRQGRVDFPVGLRSDPKQSMLDQLFEKVFCDALNDPQLEEALEKMEGEETALAEMLDARPAVGIGAEVGRM